ncbi:MAG TPA: PAS domain-containing protein [Xanthobacteraceae bacterium]|nr:PAS domain-containing protein [Xanthobacteraceae bacterium]
MKHPSSHALHAYWDALRAGRAAPERGELDPGAIRAILGDVMILEVGGPHRYAVRLAGTRICSLMGRELKDLVFAELFAAADWPELYGLLDEVVRAATPAVASIVGETEDKRMLGLELLLLPLRHHGRTEARVLCSLAALMRPYWATLTPLARLRLGSTRFENAAGTATSPAFGGARAVLDLRVIEGGRA